MKWKSLSKILALGLFLFPCFTYCLVKKTKTVVPPHKKQRQVKKKLKTYCYKNNEITVSCEQLIEKKIMHSFVENPLFVGITYDNSETTDSNKHIGLLVVATGKYIQFVQPLIESAERYFLPTHPRTYFIFTDHVDEVPKAENIIPVFQARLGWPYDTMMRCHIYAQHTDLYNDLDYMFASDADMRFVGTVGDEILGDRVATQHPGFVNGRAGAYEINQKSLAYIAPAEGVYYFAGGFYGGSRQEFITLNQTLYERIKIDLDNGIMPLWHDESHLNRYFIDVKPTKILSPSYCFPEGWNSNYHPRLIALNKNHAQMREN